MVLANAMHGFHDCGMMFTDHHANEDLDIVTRTSMAQPSVEGSSHLEALPNELLVAIFEELAPREKKSDRRIDRGPARSYHYDLCLVSKRMDLVARPFLYNKVSISDSRSLARLCRTIAANQRLGDKILEMRINVYFHRLLKHAKGGGLVRLTPAEEAEVLADFYPLIGKRQRGTAGCVDEDGQLIGILCYEVLNGTVNLCTLAILMSAYHGFLNDGRNNRQSYSAFFHRVRNANLHHADGAATSFLPKLESLTLESHGKQLSPEVFRPFLGLPSLRKVVCAREGAFWSYSAPEGVQSANKNIASFHHPGTWVCQDDLEDMARLFPALEELSVSIGIPKSFWYIPAVPGIHSELSTGLGGMSALRRLKINILPDADLSPSICRYMAGRVFVPPGRVLSLAQLPSLRHLEVPSFMMAHMGFTDLNGTTVVPPTILPQTLETLILLGHRKCSHPEGITCWDSIEVTLGFLEAFGRDLSRFDQLKTVGYRFDPNSCGNPILPAGQQSLEDETPEDSTPWRLLAIHDCYSENNVEFCLQKMTCELKGEIMSLQLEEWKP